METKEMSRMEIYFELAKYVHQDHYKKITTWKTEYLKRLLDWYTRPEEQRTAYENYCKHFRKEYLSFNDYLEIIKKRGYRIGIDWGKDEGTVYLLPYNFSKNGGKIQVTFRQKPDGRYEQVLKNLGIAIEEWKTNKKSKQ